MNNSRAIPVVQPTSIRTPRWRWSMLLALAMVAGEAAGAEEAQPVSVTIEWNTERCDFMLTKDEHGYGVVLKMSPVIALEVGDVIVGKLSSINFTGRVIKESTGEASMMRAMKYGVRRKDAVSTIVEWSRYCKPPKE